MRATDPVTGTRIMRALRIFVHRGGVTRENCEAESRTPGWPLLPRWGTPPSGNLPGGTSDTEAGEIVPGTDIF